MDQAVARPARPAQRDGLHPERDLGDPEGQAEDAVDHRQRDRPDVRPTDQDEAESDRHEACDDEPRPVPAVSPAPDAANISSTPNAIAQIATITTSATAVMFG